MFRSVSVCGELALVRHQRGITALLFDSLEVGLLAGLLVFGFGTMLGMMLMTAAISVPLVYTGKRFLKVNRHLTAISGVASMAFAIFLVYHIGFVDGLFTSQVHWIPQ